MAPRVGEDKIAEVRERANIVEVISRYVALRRSGRNHMGLCPFHGEKTASFSVSDERGFFHCFGCGASGDVFKFLMRIENLTFPEALERLAREFGIELPKQPDEARRSESRERLFELNGRAAEYFQRCLWTERTGGAAREYLRRRGIADETARRFGLGYAPAEGLARALEAARVSPALAETLGLIGKSQRGEGWYDRFRERLMFPITDLGGKVVAFGGRLLGESRPNQPKYLNSPESPVFQKRRSLFGLGAAREAIRAEDRVIVVEGYIDAIALSQAGIGNVVAPLGTAITPDQVRLLRRFTENVAVFFDGDAAGAAAAARSFTVFAEVALFADAAFLPEEHDPDSFVREAGSDGVRRLLAESSPLVDHYLRSLAPADAALPARMRAAESVAELIERSRSPIFAGLLARRASQHLGLAEDQLLRRARGAKEAAPAAPSPARPAPAPSPLPHHEAMLIELLLVHPDLREELPASIETLMSSESSRLLIARATESGVDPSSILEDLPPPSRRRVAQALLGETGVYVEPQRMLRDCLARMEQERIEGSLRALGQEIRDAEERGDSTRLGQLLREKQRLAAGTRHPGEKES